MVFKDFVSESENIENKNNQIKKDINSNRINNVYNNNSNPKINGNINNSHINQPINHQQSLKKEKTLDVRQIQKTNNSETQKRNNNNNTTELNLTDDYLFVLKSLKD